MTMVHIGAAILFTNVAQYAVRTPWPPHANMLSPGTCNTCKDLCKIITRSPDNTGISYFAEPHVTGCIQGLTVRISLITKSLKI